MLENDVQNINFYTNVAAAIFPWRIIMRNPKSTYYTFEIQASKNISLTILANILCLMVLGFILRGKPKRIFDFIFVGLFGITGLIILGIEKGSTFFEYMRRRIQQEQN